MKLKHIFGPVLRYVVLLPLFMVSGLLGIFWGVISSGFSEGTDVGESIFQ